MWPGTAQLPHSTELCGAFCQPVHSLPNWNQDIRLPVLAFPVHLLLTLYNSSLFFPHFLLLSYPPSSTPRIRPAYVTQCSTDLHLRLHLFPRSSAWVLSISILQYRPSLVHIAHPTLAELLLKWLEGGNFVGSNAMASLFPSKAHSFS